MMNSQYHLPVLKSASIEALDIQPSGIYIDATFGGGGHAREILKKLDTGLLIAFDRDEDALMNLPDSDRLVFVNHNYRYIKYFLEYMSINQVDGIFADLGISSHQIDDPERGFAHRFDGRLDMRMSKDNKLDAVQVINEYPREKLEFVLRFYGELKNNRKLVDSIIKVRSVKTIETVADLKEALSAFEPKFKPGQFWSKVFQAIRIEVNSELEGLKQFLIDGVEMLKPGGRFVIISYHSLEDRLVKNYFNTGSIDGKELKDEFGRSLSPVKALNKKSIIPEQEEIEMNTRARSAKMRIGLKL